MRFSAILVVLGWTAGNGWAQEDASGELGKAGSKAQEWTSYAFKITSKVEGMPNRGGGQRGPGGPTEGEYVADKGIHARTDNNEIIKKGDKAAMKDRDGNWSTPQQDGEGRGRRGRGDFLARLSPPHETFRDIEKNFTKVTKSTEGDLTAYSGELTADGAAKLSGRGNFGRAGGRDGDTPRKSDGTAKIYVNGDGDIVKVVVNTSTKFSRADGEETEIKSERTIEISNRGNADFQVPDEAKKILSE